MAACGRPSRDDGARWPSTRAPALGRCALLLLARAGNRQAQCEAALPGGAPKGNPECWTSGFTWEQCCNTIYGPRGNGICWDAGAYNFETCCRGDVFTPEGCRQYVAHFDFSTTALLPEVWDRCADGMEQQPDLCNSASTSSASCPACARVSEHLVRYIRCVREEQAAAVRADGGGQPDGAAPGPAIGGVHFPTVFVPRREGRDFSVAAPAFDAYVGNRLIIDGAWMHHEVRLLMGLSRPGDVVVDAGANIGGFTLPLAKHVGQDGQVHAFEPFRLLFQCLSANVMLNGLSNVYTYQVGLGNAAGWSKRQQPDLNVVANPSKMHVAEQVASELLVRTDKRETNEKVRVQRLDDIDFSDRGPSLIKVDVESMELPLLEGATETLRRYRPTLYVEDSEVDSDLDGRQRPTRVMQFLNAQRYVAFDLVRSGFRDATSTLFVPMEAQDEVSRRLVNIEWSL